VIVILAQQMRQGTRGTFDRKFYLALLMSLPTFLATTPYVLVDGTPFRTDLNLEAHSAL
jgi:hypothetical protein